jgi:hypothetical protein
MPHAVHCLAWDLRSGSKGGLEIVLRKAKEAKPHAIKFRAEGFAPLLAAVRSGAVNVRHDGPVHL